jgi:hypothetical protein
VALVAGLVVAAVGVVALVVGFAQSALAPIYVSLACSVAAAPLCVAGIVFLVMGANDRSSRGPATEPVWQPPTGEAGRPRP